MHTVCLYIWVHTGGILWKGQKCVVLCCSLVRLTWPVGSAWAISVFFWSELAAGRRGWNTVRSAEWSSEGDPSREQGRLIRGNILEGESSHWTAPPVSSRLLNDMNEQAQWSKQQKLEMVKNVVCLVITRSVALSHGAVNLSLNRPLRHESSVRLVFVFCMPSVPLYSYPA